MMKKILLISMTLLLTSLAAVADETLPQLPTPTIYYFEDYGEYTVVVEGQGQLHLFVNGEEVYGTSCTIPMTNEEQHIFCQAYASDPPDYQDSEVVSLEFTVPALVIPDAPIPEVTTFIEDDYAIVYAYTYGDAELTMYDQNNNEVEIPYYLERTDSDYEVQLLVKSHMEGCNDVFLAFTVVVPAREMQQLPTPVIHSSLENSIFSIQVEGMGNLHLLIFGEEVEGATFSTRLEHDVEYDIECEAYATEPGYIDSEHAYATFTVPMELHGPYLYDGMSDDEVSFMAETDGVLTVIINGEEVYQGTSNYTFGFPRLDEDYYVTVTLIASKTGHTDIVRTWQILVPARAIVADYDFEEDGIYYKITDDGKVSVSYKDKTYNSYSGVVSIPNTVTHDGVTYMVTGIRQAAFNNCTDLTAVNIGSYVTEIGSYAFEGCSKLENVVIGDYVITIDDYAFYDCTALKSVTLGSGVKTINASAFAGCTDLTDVFCKPATPPVITYSSAFECYETATLHVYPPVRDSYASSNNWSRFTTIVGENTVAPAQGDINGDGKVNIGDVTTLINNLLRRI